MQWNDEFQKYALKVISDAKLYPSKDWLGLAYITFIEDMKAYDETKSNVLTYFGFRLKERIQRERRYDYIIPIPVLKQNSTTIETFSIYVENENGEEFINSIPAPDSYDNRQSLDAFIHIIESLEGELNGKQLEALKCLKTAIINDEDIKLNVHRQYLSDIRKIIKDKYEKEYN